MKWSPDQRRAQRFARELPLVCSSLDGQGIYSARTINHCESGLGFITQTPLKAGMTIYFRADLGLRPPPEETNRPVFRGTGLARIRWTRPMDDQIPGRYCVGAEYVDPYL
jgi:hypothetical protein